MLRLSAPAATNVATSIRAGGASEGAAFEVSCQLVARVA